MCILFADWLGRERRGQRAADEPRAEQGTRCEAIEAHRCHGHFSRFRLDEQSLRLQLDRWPKAALPWPARTQVHATPVILARPDQGPYQARYFIETITASPPRLNIRPVRFAFKCMMTPLRFLSQRSPALALPMTMP
jgi:hypothetical protein